LVNGEISITINSALDILSAREKGKELAKKIGFRGSELTLLSTLISDLARKVVTLECKGNLVIQSLQSANRKGIAISISEIPKGDYNIFDKQVGRQAKDILSHDERLLVLATRRIADEFEVKHRGDNGSAVRVVKWL